MASILLAVLMAATPGAEPIRLETVTQPGGVEVRVVGLSQAPLNARYRLEVSSGSGNRSTQSGEARLSPGQAATLVRTRVSSGPSGNWSARLLVEPERGAAYERQADGRF